MTMSSAAILPSDTLPQPLQFKGEIMDFDLAGLEVDHRKRRRNRTTQSCLNCHTSKRKCDRKRPCQRCIQLGLTGLCVYEVDDPALRDDPNIDENTRLRNRIAELESLVRELRGKPHPKWAEPSFCDGDANEKWHSRSSRRLQYQKVPRDRHDDGGGHLQGANGRVPPAIKTEQASDPSQQNLYRFTPSPTHPAAVDGGSGHSYTTLYRNQQTHGHGQSVYSPADDSSCYSSPSSASVMTYGEARHGAHGVSNGDHYYQDQQQQYVQAASCACLTNPAAANALIGFTSQLQNTAVLLRQLPEHNTSRQACVILRRVTELNDIMHGNTVPNGSSSYEGLSTPTETELSMSPISTSSQSSIGAGAPTMHEQWPSATMGQSAAYDSYFPVAATQPEHAAVFHKTYHIS